MIDALEEKGLAYRAPRRRRELRGAALSRLRQALRQVARRAARRRARRGRTPPSTTRSISCCGSTPSPASRTGSRRGARAVPAGTSSARRWAARCSASTSTSTAAARTCSSRTTRTRSRSPRAPNGEAVRQLLDAQRLRARRRREDVEVARQLLHRSATCSRSSTRRWCASSSLRAHYRSPLNYSRPAPRRREGTRSTRLYTALKDATSGRGRRLERAARRALQGGDGRRLQHARGRRGAVRARQLASTPATKRAAAS